MAEPLRDLRDREFRVLAEIQAYWGEQNTLEDVFFPAEGEAAMFVRARDGSRPVLVQLTNLGQWHADGTLTARCRPTPFGR